MSNDTPTPRERARAETMQRIVEAARAELRTSGPDGLSLRAIAREVGLVSSAVYRYVASRDELLTELIVADYEALGAAVTAGVAGRASPGRRFVRGCAAAREWAVRNPQDHALLFGTPVPGYLAPERTIAAAAIAPVALVSTVQDAWRAGTLAVDESPLRRALQAQATRTASDLGLDDALPPQTVVAFVQAWIQVLGLIGLERSGYLANTFDPADELAAATFTRAARDVGFTDL